MEGQALLTLGVAQGAQPSGPVWVNDDETLHAFGNGVVLQHVEKGTQRHVFGWAETDVGTLLPEPPVFAACPKKQLVAYSQSGQAPSIFVASAATLHPYCVIKDTAQQHAPWVHLALSDDGSRLASVGCYPEHVLEIWDLPEPPPAPKHIARIDPTSLQPSPAKLCASIPLGPRLVQLKPTFFPLNSNVVAVGGPDAVRLLFLDQVGFGGSCITRQSDVDLSILREGEHVTALGWTPSGALLLGTTLGKVQLVTGAAPCGVAEPDWGTTPSYHRARSMFNSNVASRAKGWPAGLGSIVDVKCLPGQQIIATTSPPPKAGQNSCEGGKHAGNNNHGGEADHTAPCANIMWLDASSSHFSLAAMAALPFGTITSAEVSPNQAHVLLRTDAGEVALASTAYSIPEQLPRLTKQGTVAASRAARTKSVRRPEKQGTAAGSSLNAARISALQSLGEEDGEGQERGTEGQLSPSSSIKSGSPSISNRPTLTQIMGSETFKPAKSTLPISTAVAAVVSTRILGLYHAGPVTGLVAFEGEVFATGGCDCTLRLWQCSHLEPRESSQSGSEASEPSPSASRSPSRTGSRSPSPQPQPLRVPKVPALDAALVGMWRLQSPVTCVLRYGDTPLLVAGTAGGEVHMLDVERFKEHQQSSRTQNTGDAAKDEAEAHAASAVWEQRLFSHPVSSMAFSSDGSLFAAVSPQQNLLALYRVVPIGTSPADVTLQLLGFYDIVQPRLVSFSPKDFAAIEKKRPGAPPRLVVSTILGEVQVLHMPETLNHLRQDSAQIPPVSLLHGLLRVHSPITAMTTVPVTTAAGNTDVSVLDGSFWLIACCLDKSVKRIRLPLQQHVGAARAAISARASVIEQLERSGKAGTYTVPRIGMATTQNFQVPEIEKPMDLDAPVCHISMSETKRQLVMTSLAGSVTVYGFPDLIPHARWPLHAPVPVQQTALALSLGSQKLPTPEQLYVHGGAAAMTSSMLVSGASDGCIVVVALEENDLLGIVGGWARQRGPSSGQVPQAKPARRSISAARGGFGTISAPAGLGKAVVGAGQARPVHAQAPPVVACAPEDAKVLGWKDAPLAARRKSKASSIAEAEDKLRKKKAELAKRMQELRVINSTQGEGKLAESEFVIDVSLEEELRREADKAVEGSKAHTTNALEVPQIQYGRLMAMTKESVEEQAQLILSLPEYNFITNMSADDAKRLKDAGSVIKVPCVSSYSIRRLDINSADKLRKVSFLRRVEQEEWQGRPLLGRGPVTFLRRWKGPLTEKGNADQQQPGGPNQGQQISGAGAGEEAGASITNDARSLPHQDSASVTQASDTGDMSARDLPSARSMTSAREQEPSADESEIMGCEVHNGACKLLYSNLQLHAPTRKAAQAIFLQEEIRCLQREFNTQFVKLRLLKHQQLERLNDKGKRVEAIQKGLAEVAASAARAQKFIKTEAKNSSSTAANNNNNSGTSGNASGGGVAGSAHPEAQIEYSWDLRENWENLLQVADEEVPVDRWASPEMRALLQARQAEAEEQRRKLEADDSKQRALKDMMNSTLEFRKKDTDAEDVLRYEPWMDTPRSMMTLEQRKHMAELEKRAMEALEECEKAARQLEMERKAVETDMYGQVFDFNNKVAALHGAKLKADSQLRAFELHVTALTCSIEELHTTNRARDKVLKINGDLSRRRNVRTNLIIGAQAAVKKATSEYEGIQAQERALDKAMRREFLNVDEDLRDAVLAIYRDRRRALTGNPIRPAAEILSRTAEGASLQSRPQTGADQPHGRRYGGMPDRFNQRPATSSSEAVPKPTPIHPGPDQPLPEPTPLTELTRWMQMTRNQRHQHQQQNHRASRANSGGDLPEFRSMGGTNRSLQPRPSSHIGREDMRFTEPGIDADDEPDAEGVMANLNAALAAHASQQVPFQRLLAWLQAANARGLGPAIQAAATGAGMRGLLPDDIGPLGLSPSIKRRHTSVSPDLPPSLKESSDQGEGRAVSAFKQEHSAAMLLQESSGQALASPDPFAAQWAHNMFDPSCAQLIQPASALQGVTDPLSLPPFTPADKPADLEPVWWHRLQEYRDSRIELERAGDATWQALVLATYVLEKLEHEEQQIGEAMESVTDAKVALHITSVEAANNMMLQLIMQNGQVELPSVSSVVEAANVRWPGRPVSFAHIIRGITSADALLLHRQSIVQVNMGVRHEGQKKVAALHDIKRSNTAIHLAKWEVRRSELRGSHAAAELSHIQLLHVTKDLQAVLRNPTAMSRLDQDSQLLALAEAAHASHEARKAMKARTVHQLTTRIANSIEVQEELSAAQAAVETDMADGAAIADVIARSRAEEETSHRRALRSIITNVQLKDIAAAQAHELEVLQAQLNAFRARTYPNIDQAAAESGQPYWAMAPDLRVPQLAPGGVRSRPISRPHTVPVNVNRPLWSAGSSRGPPGAMLSGLPPTRGKGPPRPYSTLGEARRRKQM